MTMFQLHFHRPFAAFETSTISLMFSLLFSATTCLSSLRESLAPAAASPRPASRKNDG